MKSVLALLVLCVCQAVPANAQAPKNTGMPISKVWQRKFVKRSFAPQTRIPRIPAVARPLGRANKIDVNSCTLEELQNLPGVGAAMGAHIMAGRPYRDFDDLSRDGVPLSTVDQIRAQVSFGR
jgi:DNA uptake protein ComE-like DNA-binding protein